MSNNWAQYQKSITAEKMPGGGGWSLIVFNLGALYEEWELLHNWWTKSNKGLPLIRYNYCTLKFYRSLNTDYVVTYTRCYPMLDSKYTHANSQPSRMLMSNKKIIVRRYRHHGKQKPYIKKRIYPPAQMQNHWYFQQDLCNTGLLMITTTACSLDEYYLSAEATSNCITVTCLNTKFFSNPNYKNTDGTSGYQPKNNIFLYAGYNGTDTPKWNELTYLGNTHKYSKGQTLTNTNKNDKNTWGNPFHYEYANEQVTLFLSNKSPISIQDNEFDKNATVTKVTEPMYIRCRYNPHADKGYGNEAYFLSNSIAKGNVWDLPSDPNVIIQGFPLWLELWGWYDWQVKLKQINHIYDSYTLVFKSSYLTPTLPAYVVVDEKFYLPRENELTETDKVNWYIKWQYQQYGINEICSSGPGTPKFTDSRSIQAKLQYTFNFKIGGCPAPMEEVRDPCSQGKYPIPNKIYETPEIENPQTEKSLQLYHFDERRQTITKTAIQRIREHSELTKPIFTDGTSPMDPPVLQTLEEESEETQTQKETQTPIQLQLLQLKQQQLLLKRRLLRLISQRQPIE